MDVLRRSLAPTTLLVLVLFAVGGAHEQDDAFLSHRIPRANSSSSGTDESSGGSMGGQRTVDWIGQHWYAFVVILVTIVVVVIFACGCVVRRSGLSSYHMQIHQNGNHYSPHMRSSTNHSAFTERVTLPSPRQNSNHTVDAGSSIYQHAQNSLVAIANSTRSSTGNIPVAAPPIANDSPWSFIQSVTKGKGRQGDLIEGRGEEAGEREGVPLGQNYFKKPCSHHSHCHHHHHSHCHHHSPSSHLHRNYHSPHRHLSNHLHKVNGITDDSGASLCSLPSISGSMQSNCSVLLSNLSNRSMRSNMSSQTHSNNSTVVEVDVNVQVSPDHLDKTKAVAVGALAESARQLADSAASMGGGEEAHSRSLPHSPYPPPRNPLRHPRHSVTGTPLTSHSLPPSSLLDCKHLFQGHSSSPLHSSHISVKPATPSCVRHTISLDRKTTQYCYPHTSVGGCCTEDGGTVVSLDHYSSSSSCHCSSMVSYEHRQRSISTHSPSVKKGLTIVSLDQYSNGETVENDADMTVVSLDRTNHSGDHRMRHANHERTCIQDPKYTHMTHFNLESQIEDTPLKRQPSGNLYHSCEESNSPRPMFNRGKDQCAMNGYLDHPMYIFPSNHSSSKLTLHQQLQNISECRESGWFQLDDNFKLKNEALAQHNVYRHRVLELAGNPGELDKTMKVNVGQVDSSVRKTGKMKRRRYKKHGWKRTNGIGEAVVCDRPDKDVDHIEKETTGNDGEMYKNRESSGGTGVDSADSDVKNMDHIERETAGDNGLKCTDFGEKIPQAAEMSCSAKASSPDSLQDSFPQESYVSQHCSSSPLQQYSASSDRLSSPSLHKPESPPRSSSALSVSEPLSSTASGYAATGESGSTCDAEFDSSSDECAPEFHGIQSALFEARSQFSYPLHRLLDQDYELENAGLDNTLRSSPHPHLSSQSQTNQSHPGSDSEYHSVLLSTIGSRVQSLQQIQSVDV